MKKAIFPVLVSVMVLLLFASAYADGDRATNPCREDIAAFERKIRNIRDEQADGETIELPRSYFVGTKGLSVTCNRAPAFNGTGNWSIALQNHNPSQVKKMTIFLGMKDWTSDYSHIYWKERQKGEDDPVFVSSFTSPVILTCGEYEVYFWITYDDGQDAYYYQEYSISGPDALSLKIIEAAAQCNADDDWQTALNLHDWLVRNMYYDLNYEFYGADSILRGYGCCDSYSKIYYLLCRTAGIPAIRVQNSNHSWNAVRLGGNWYYVDCTWDDPVGSTEKQSGDENHTYFCLNQTLTAMDHPYPWDWYGNSEPSCVSLDANYTVKTGEWKDWGDYSWIYGEDPVVHTLSEQAVSAFDNGEKRFVVDWDRRSDDSGNVYLWKTVNGELSAVYIGNREKTILNYVFPGVSLAVDGDPVRVSVGTTSSAITLSLAGWDIDEKGTLTLPTNLDTVSEEAFMNNDTATTLVIQPGCEEIESGAFRNCGIRTVSVPDSVKKIADDAFDGCGRIIFKTNSDLALQYAKDHRMLTADP